MAQDLNKIFNKFANRPLNVTEDPIAAYGTTFFRPSLDAKDPVIADLKKFALKRGFSKVRVILPEHMVTADVQRNRLNARVVKGQDNKYRISSFTAR